MSLKDEILKEEQEAGSTKHEETSPQTPLQEERGFDAESVVYMQLSEISQHPKKDMYNTEIEPEFLEGIRKYGIQTPISVVEGSIFSPPINNYVIVSGHRRYRAAEELGFEVVPAIVKNDIKTEDEAFAIFVICNMQREKNLGERIREFKAYKQILSHIPKGNDKIDIYEDENFEKEFIVRILTEKKKDAEKPVLWRDIIREATGFSEYEQHMINQIDEDALDKFLQKLRNAIGKNPKKEEEIYKAWMKIYNSYLNEEIKLYSAVKEIEEYVNRMTDELIPKKKRKPRAIKEEVPGEDDEFDAGSLLFKEIIKKPIKFASAGSTRKVEYGYLYNENSKAPEIQESIMGTVAKSLVGLVLKKGGQFYKLDINELAKLLD